MAIHSHIALLKLEQAVKFVKTALRKATRGIKKNIKIKITSAKRSFNGGAFLSSRLRDYMK